MIVLSKSKAFKFFDFGNHIFLFIVSLICILPFINIIAISFSDKSVTAANLVSFWPKGFNTNAYELLISNKNFFISFGVSIKKVIVGVCLNMVLIVLTAYPLSMESNKFKGRNMISWYFIFTMLFSGGLIPLFILVSKMHMINSFWALVLPGAVPVFNVVIMMNFFRGLPASISESAKIDGASHWKILFIIFIPLSLPSIATLTLFSVVNHWNDYFTGLFLMSDSNKWPLQTYLYSQLFISIDINSMNPEQVRLFSSISNRSLKAAQIIIGTIPILLIYPFLQQFFVSGLTIGSVKE